MPAARARGGEDGTAGAPAAQQLQNALQGLRRQKARDEEAAEAAPAAEKAAVVVVDGQADEGGKGEPKAEGKSNGKANTKVEAKGLQVAQRLGLPLTGNTAAAVTRRAKRTAMPPVASEEVAELIPNGRSEANGDTAVLYSAPAKRRLRAWHPDNGASRTPGQRGAFGAMLGHLKSARQRLEDEGIRQVSHPEGRLDEEAERRMAIHQASKEKEMLLLQQRLEAHYVNMKNFIRTQAEPTIFYLPAKHNPGTMAALEESRAAIEQKIRSLRVHLRCNQEDSEPDHYGGRRESEAEEEEADEDENDEEEEEEEEASSSEDEDSG